MNELIIYDLRRSLLNPDDLHVRPLGVAERSALGLHSKIEGFVIPYFDINGNPTPYYRARLFNTTTKYRQPEGTRNALYFPKGFLESVNGHKYVIIAEGEKKAACAVRNGFPCVGVGGIYSWRNRTVKLPASNLSVKTHKDGAIDLGVGTTNTIKLKLDGLDIDSMFSEYADGFKELMQLVRDRKLSVIIAYDSTSRGIIHKGHITLDVQTAAARLGIEIRANKILLSKIKQIVLPLNGADKMGIDDLLSSEGGPDKLSRIINDALKDPRRFPVHPNIHDFVGKKLSNPKMTRKDVTGLGLTIISDLDARGKRLKSSEDKDLFYFDNQTKQLMPVTSSSIRHSTQGPLIFDDFRNLLYQSYGLIANDTKILTALSTQISSESPIDPVVPRKGTFSLGDTICHQINNHTYVSVTSKSIDVHDNGDRGVMFECVDGITDTDIDIDIDTGTDIDINYPSEIEVEFESVDGEQPEQSVKQYEDFESGCGESVSASKLLRELEQQRKGNRLIPWWYETLCTTRIQDDDNHTQKKLTTLLYYVSPWLLRWRGSQLPIELTTGEAGSGKSTLYALRLEILTGRQDLKNRPQSLKDWHASVLSTGGLYVVDNANLDGEPSLGQAISDEMCRMVTEPRPAVEMRRYYTEKGLLRVPSHVVFAMTAVKMPFKQLDLMQRSFHLHLEKGVTVEDTSFEADWLTSQLRSRGGRTAWTAHHLLVLKRFLELVKERWNPHYKAKYRLINFEQILMLMAEVFEWESDWIPQALSSRTKETSVESDWMLRGVKAYTDHIRQFVDAGNLHLSSFKILPRSISDWAAQDDEYCNCRSLVNSSSVAKFLHDHKSLVASVTGLVPSGLTSGKTFYKLQTSDN